MTKKEALAVIAKFRPVLAGYASRCSDKELREFDEAMEQAYKTELHLLPKSRRRHG